MREQIKFNEASDRAIGKFVGGGLGFGWHFAMWSEICQSDSARREKSLQGWSVPVRDEQVSETNIQRDIMPAASLGLPYQHGAQHEVILVQQILETSLESPRDPRVWCRRNLTLDLTPNVPFDHTSGGIPCHSPHPMYDPVQARRTHFRDEEVSRPVFLPPLAIFPRAGLSGEG